MPQHSRVATFDGGLEVVTRQLEEGAPLAAIEVWIDAQTALSEDERAALAFILDGEVRPNVQRLVVFEPMLCLG